MSMRHETGVLAQDARDALAGLDRDTLVTLDGADVPAAASTGTLCVVLGPPAVVFTTSTIRDVTWTLWLVAGPDLAAGWDGLDTLLDTLAGPLDLDTADPDTITGPRGTSWPAYRCTTTARYTHT